MNIPDSTLDQLFKSLSEYNPTTNQVMEKIATVMQPLAMAIVGILFLIELGNYSKKFNYDDGGMTTEVFINIAAKYLVAWALIMSSSHIIDGIVWFFIQMAKWIHSVLPLGSGADTVPGVADGSWWQKPLMFLFQIIAYVFIGVASVITNILVFLRSVQLYIVKAVAPILIAFFVSEEMKSTAVGFLKQVMAFALQGALLILLIGLIPVLTTNDFLSISFSGDFWDKAGEVIQCIMTYIALILKYIAIIILLIGSQNMAKRFVGAM